MDDKHEQVAVAGVLDRLEEQFPDLDPAMVEAAVRLACTEPTGNPIRNFVPVLVEHTAKQRLAFGQRERTIEEAFPPPDERPDGPQQDLDRLS